MTRKLSKLIRTGYDIAQSRGIVQGFGGYFGVNESGQHCADTLGMALWALHPAETWQEMCEFEPSGELRLEPEYPDNHGGLEQAVPWELLYETGNYDNSDPIQGCNPVLWVLIMNDEYRQHPLSIAEALERLGM
jgi:hypothetical protein